MEFLEASHATSGRMRCHTGATQQLSRLFWWTSPPNRRPRWLVPRRSGKHLPGLSNRHMCIQACPVSGTKFGGWIRLIVSFGSESSIIFISCTTISHRMFGNGSDGRLRSMELRALSKCCAASASHCCGLPCFVLRPLVCPFSTALCVSSRARCIAALSALALATYDLETGPLFDLGNSGSPL